MPILVLGTRNFHLATLAIAIAMRHANTKRGVKAEKKGYPFSFRPIYVASDPLFA